MTHAHAHDKPPRRDRQVNFVFRCQPRLKTKHGVLLDYLNNEEESILTRKERILQALSAYWLPLAAKRRGGVSRERLQQLARDAIYHLQIHIKYLEETFGLDSRALLPLPRHDGLEALLDDDGYTEPDGHDEEDDILSSWK